MGKVAKIIERRKKVLDSIAELEEKRKRSECGLVNSIIQDRQMDEQDVKFFNEYTSRIEIYEEELKELDEALLELHVKP